MLTAVRIQYCMHRTNSRGSLYIHKSQSLLRIICGNIVRHNHALEHSVPKLVGFDRWIAASESLGGTVVHRAAHLSGDIIEEVAQVRRVDCQVQLEI